MSRNWIIHVTLFAALLGTPMLASAHHEQDHAVLAKELAALQEKVTALDALKPSFAAFMPAFAERFHVLHFAGDAGDWKVAGHEYAELKSKIEAAVYVDAEKGKLFKAMLTPGFSEIGEAIESGDGKRLDTALKQTITACNACHQAAGSGFLRVTLDTKHVLSLRHSHILSTTEAGGHMHGGEGMMQGGEGMMQGKEAAGHGHSGEKTKGEHTD